MDQTQRTRVSRLKFNPTCAGLCTGELQLFDQLGPHPILIIEYPDKSRKTKLFLSKKKKNFVLTTMKTILHLLNADWAEFFFFHP